MRELKKINYGKDFTEIADVIHECSSEYSILDIFGIYIYTLSVIAKMFVNSHASKSLANMAMNNMMGKPEKMNETTEHTRKFNEWYINADTEIFMYNNDRHYIYNLNTFDFDPFSTFTDIMDNCYDIGEKELLLHNGEKTFVLYTVSFLYNMKELTNIKVDANIEAITNEEDKYIINRVNFNICNLEDNHTASTSFEFSMDNDSSIMVPIEVVCTALVGFKNQISKDTTKFELSLLKSYKNNNFDVTNLLYNNYKIIFEDMDLFNSDEKYIANLNNPEYKIANSKYRSNIDDLIRDNSILLVPKKSLEEEIVSEDYGEANIVYDDIYDDLNEGISNSHHNLKPVSIISNDIKNLVSFLNDHRDSYYYEIINIHGSTNLALNNYSYELGSESVPILLVFEIVDDDTSRFISFEKVNDVIIQHAISNIYKWNIDNCKTVFGNDYRKFIERSIEEFMNDNGIKLSNYTSSTFNNQKSNNRITHKPSKNINSGNNMDDNVLNIEANPTSPNMSFNPISFTEIISDTLMSKYGKMLKTQVWLDNADMYGCFKAITEYLNISFTKFNEFNDDILGTELKDLFLINRIMINIYTRENLIDTYILYPKDEDNGNTVINGIMKVTNIIKDSFNNESVIIKSCKLNTKYDLGMNISSNAGFININLKMLLDHYIKGDKEQVKFNNELYRYDVSMFVLGILQRLFYDMIHEPKSRINNDYLIHQEKFNQTKMITELEKLISEGILTKDLITRLLVSLTYNIHSIKHGIVKNVEYKAIDNSSNLIFNSNQFIISMENTDKSRINLILIDTYTDRYELLNSLLKIFKYLNVITSDNKK